MGLEEILGGAIIYAFQISNLKHKRNVKYFRIDLTQHKKSNKGTDGIFKKILLIFFASFFDFDEFIIIVFYVPKYDGISATISGRLALLETIVMTLFCSYALRYKMGKHQKFSLLIFSSFFFITIILDVLYKSNNISIGEFLLAHLLICFYYVFLSFTGVIEYYLCVYDFLNPFLTLMIEGIFVFIMSIIYSINKEPFKEIITQYKNTDTGNFVLLIFVLSLYFFCSAFLNVYKIYCNVVYSPMERSFSDYFFVPFFNIFYFIWKNDFHNDYFYFFICEIIGLIIDFFGCVFNEYLIIFCFGLDYDTSESIALRALEKETLSGRDTINPGDENYIFNFGNKQEIEFKEII